MSRTELVIQLIKVALGLLIGLFRLVEPGGAAETAATLVRARGPPRWLQVTAFVL